MNLLKQTTGQLALHHPLATQTLKQMNIDYLNNPHQKLEEAFTSTEDDMIRMSQQLIQNQCYASEQDDSNLKEYSTSQLIDYILWRYHQWHRAQLNALVELLDDTPSQHDDQQRLQSEIRAFIHAQTLDLEQHMQKEEAILFPMMQQNSAIPKPGPIQVMMREHEIHQSQFPIIDQFICRLNQTPHQALINRILVHQLNKFKVDLSIHIHIENNILFPRFG
ncbi:hypothetical protein BFW38_13155 [Terasakiispira papahanaumokuakeensis]|uniref:Hemerythrin-like domain-containing protein n=1 Tax=Terasakiispira papahanaumokuakeensis TaxID=197479 RepID=A0A1E2VBF6_9GAMM|nr:hemerythrin domain-containing protein [Terasakiispira papahanaumokuakeensis]ODC04338.1 hypothetical protein BFW38_13155 [Terasakiispira papahanaumokuakeensis]